MSYLGNSPGVASQRVVTTFTATAGQTVFTPQSGYTLGYCDVFLNGIKLVNGDDYTASNGTSITLASGAAAGDSVEVVAYFPRGLSDGYTKAETDARHVLKSGDTMSGSLTLSNAASHSNFLVQTSGASYHPVYQLNNAVGDWDIGLIGANQFSIRDRAAGYAQRLIVDSAGRVTMPYQPRFAAYGTSGGTSYGDGAAFVLGGTSINIGGCYNVSNGRFTAPVSGYYIFNYGIYSNVSAQMVIQKNGSAYAPTSSDAQGMVSMVAAEARGASIGLNLAANDFVTYGWRSGSSGSVYLAHGWFTGHLVG